MGIVLGEGADGLAAGLAHHYAHQHLIALRLEGKALRGLLGTHLGGRLLWSSGPEPSPAQLETNGEQDRSSEAQGTVKNSAGADLKVCEAVTLC